MIEVVRYDNGIKLEGHAGYAPHSTDIVCASVSALLQTFIVSVEDLCTDKLNTAITSGNAVIQYRDLTEQAQVLLDSFFIGINMIADSYPSNVRVIDNTCPGVEGDKSYGDKEQACNSLNCKEN